MIRNKLAWLLCATTAVACATPTQPTDAGRDASREATVDVVSRPDASRPDSGPTCSMGQIACNGVCVNAQTDNMNCGACGTACPMGQSCMMGACQNIAMCGAGQTDCSGTCVNTQTDSNNCGACGMACPRRGRAATAGACRMAIMCPVGTDRLRRRVRRHCVEQHQLRRLWQRLRCRTGVHERRVRRAHVHRRRDALRRTLHQHADGRDQLRRVRQRVSDGTDVHRGRVRVDHDVPRDADQLQRVCVDTQTSAANCGACGRACAMGQTCTAGACMGMLVCPMGADRVRRCVR
jgi:hypothetical protein